MPNLDNGQWVPEDHPLYLDEQKRKSGTSAQAPPMQQAGGPSGAEGPPLQQPGAPGEVNVQAPPLQPAGGAQTGNNGWQREDLNGMAGYRNPSTGQWVPGDHPIVTQTGNTPIDIRTGQNTPTTGPTGTPGAPAPGGGTSYVPPNSAPGTPGDTPLDTQAKNAQTYSQTPGAAPANNTMNQGTQDVYRNTNLQQATQGTRIDPNDPNIRQQSDAFRAQAVRAARELQADQAVANGPYADAFTRGQQRLTAERAGQAAGGFEAELIGRELQNRRDEIQTAIGRLGEGVENDQRRQLERELANLNADIQRMGINSNADIAGRELALKDKLGMGGLNVDLARILQQGRIADNELGFNIADREAFYNNLALQNLF